MRVNEATILMLPGRGDAPPEHWQSRWQAKLSRARRVEHQDWRHPTRAAWVASTLRAIHGAEKPVVLVAHSLGGVAALWALPQLEPGAVAGLFLVAPPSEARIAAVAEIDDGFAPVPRQTLPCPAVLVASRNDPVADFGWSEALAASLGADLVDAGEAGHIDAEAGYGPWPEGLMRFGGFMRRL